MKSNAKKLIEKMEKERGFGRLWRRILAERDTVFMEKIHDINLYVLYRKDGLPPKYVDMVICVIDALTNYEPGFRIHFRKALEEGLTEIEMLQALEICTMSGIQYISRLLPALEEISQSVKNE